MRTLKSLKWYSLTAAIKIRLSAIRFTLEKEEWQTPIADCSCFFSPLWCYQNKQTLNATLDRGNKAYEKDSALPQRYFLSYAFFTGHKILLPAISDKLERRVWTSFHLNGYTLGFYLQTQKLESPCTADNKQYNRKVLLSSFHLNGRHFRISSTDSKFRTTLYSIINSTTGKYCSEAFIWMVTL